MATLKARKLVVYRMSFKQRTNFVNVARVCAASITELSKSINITSPSSVGLSICHALMIGGLKHTTHVPWNTLVIILVLYIIHVNIHSLERKLHKLLFNM